jgi:hypothetical protein
VYPAISHFYALFADMLVGGRDFDLIQVLAFCDHDGSPNIID